MNSETTNVASSSAFLQDVVDGLSEPRKTLPSKYFYDQRGSALFDQVCELDEYYVTRTELAIMDRHADEMADQLGERVKLVELGSGSSIKTQWLLESLHQPAAYVPVDISRKHLLATAAGLREQFPNIEILPVVADFTRPFVLPESKLTASHNAVYFPGSTIGNFEPDVAAALLKNISDCVGRDGGLLIGADLQKEEQVLLAAYNDQAGVTAEFNLNLLRRANRELGSDFNLDQFHHRAVYDQEHGRIEMHLVSDGRQTVQVGEHAFDFEDGESIRTELSHKYTVAGFEALVARAGFELHRTWLDEQSYFGVFHFVHADD